MQGFAWLRQQRGIGREGLKAAWGGGELQREEPESVNKSPCGEGPVGAVPQSADEEDDDSVTDHAWF